MPLFGDFYERLEVASEEEFINEHLQVDLRKERSVLPEVVFDLRRKTQSRVRLANESEKYKSDLHEENMQHA